MGRGVFFLRHPEMCIWEFLVFSFFFLNFWINKWMRAESFYSWNSLLRVVLRRFGWPWQAGPPAGPAWSGGGSAGEAPTCQPKPGSRMKEGGWRPLSPHHDRVSSNKQNHTDTWGGVKTRVFAFSPEYLNATLHLSHTSQRLWNKGRPLLPVSAPSRWSSY